MCTNSTFSVAKNNAKSLTYTIPIAQRADEIYIAIPTIYKATVGTYCRIQDKQTSEFTVVVTNGNANNISVIDNIEVFMIGYKG